MFEERMVWTVTSLETAGSTVHDDHVLYVLN